MADKIFLNARYAFRSDTLENWQRLNPVLEKGEPAVVTDGVNGEWLKIGDGINTFNNLAWRKGPKGEQGIRGIQGVKGDKGDNYVLTLEDKQEIANMVDVETVTVDPTYNPTSENAQSGKAVAQALAETVVGSGVYVGSGEMPEGYNVQVDPNGEAYELSNTFSAAIKNTVSGLVVSANDVSPIEHNLGVKVSSNNLFDKSIPYGDYLNIIGGYGYLPIWVGKGNTVTVSLSQKHPTGLGGYCYIRDNGTNSGGGPEQKWLYHNTNDGLCNKSQTITSVDGYVSVYFTVETYNNLKDELQVEIGTTATEYEPYVEPPTVTIRRYGKNLYDLYAENVRSFGGTNSFDATSKSDGRLTISSDNKKITTLWHCPVFQLYSEKLPKGSYTFSFKCGFENSVPKGATPNCLYVNFDGVQNSGKSLYDGSHNITFNLEKETTIEINFYKHIYASPEGQGSEYASDTIYKADFWDIQLESGKNATEYEEYKQLQEAAANADGIVTGLTSISPNMTIMADNNGANLNVTYNVDTKTYIDNKFAELAQAILNS